MTRKDYGILYLIGLILAAAWASFQAAPGYMDADYYYLGGVQLAEGKGFWENVLWNYLDDPAGLPHPSHAYWMPLASILAAAGIWTAGTSTFWAAKIPFVLLAAGVPVVSAAVGYRLTGRRGLAWLAGLLGLTPGFYASYVTLTETFTLYMLLGGGILLVGGVRGGEMGWKRAAGLGALAGGMHLARADGILWLAGCLAWIVWEGWRARQRGWKIAGQILLAAALYGAVMGVWFGRNLNVFGQWMPPGGSRALWITTYDETYSYPAEKLTPERWLSQGWANLLGVRWDALKMNLQTALGVQFQIVLLPLAVWGFFRVRQKREAQIGGLMWLATLGVMTAVFPFAGSRGGFFHSGAAVQPLIWGLSAAGLDSAVGWAARKRRWNPQQAVMVLGGGLVMINLAVSASLYAANVIGEDAGQPKWSRSWEDARRTAALIQAQGGEPQDVVMINNPPGYAAANRQPAIAVPNETTAVMLGAARRYQARWLVLDENVPEPLEVLFLRPESQTGLRLGYSSKEVVIYEILPE